MRRLLIIESDSASREARVESMISDEETLSCDIMAWESVAPTLTQCAHDLVVLVATSHTANILAWLENRAIGAPVLVVLPGDIDDALLQCTSRIAEDFIVLPFGPAEFRNRINRLLAQPLHDLEAVRRRLLEEMNLTKLVGRDPIFLQAISQLPRIARSDVSVCITGETGTGKELCARSIHHLSRRRVSPFIAVDCGALPDQLFENEVFGHSRGAFTDAHRDQKGLVAMADSGTLFFDEVDALSVPAQAKLLRFLQERTYRPLGSERFCSADVRVIAATNRDLEGSVQELQFRSDLFFRLNVLRLRLPPLRDRRSDIEILAYAALKEYSCTDDDVMPRTFSPSALRILSLYDWPGNVRELYNVVQRAAIACGGDCILPRDLDLPNLHVASPTESGCAFRTARAAAVASFEKRYVEELLRKHRGNVTQAAREAQQDRRAFGRFIKKYNIDRCAWAA